MKQRDVFFKQEIAKLNEAQYKAVTSIEGPMLVIAGPGTGKTHILASRIGYILQETDTRPQDILCLTYTDAATQAMRERLVQLIGPDAHRVPIFTYHAFCNKVLQDNPQLFSRLQTEEPASQLMQVQLLQSLLDELPAEHPLHSIGNGQGRLLTTILRLFEKMKKEGWNYEDIARDTQKLIEQMPEMPLYQYQKANQKQGIKKGDVKQTEVDDLSKRYLKFASAASLYEAYQAKMQALGAFDFDDMIAWVLEAFAQNETLLRRYQEQFLYVLVDEFQDTNGTQNKLVHQLMDYWENPNLFVVGDDDQSIFEFQGARLQHIVELYHRYAPHIKVVVLKENYRSSQPILDMAGKLIAENQLRLIHQVPELQLNKQIRGVKGLGPAPECLVFPDERHETMYIAQQVIALHAAGTPWHEIAIIVNQHKQYQDIRMLLEKWDVPTFSKKPVNALMSLPGRHLFALLVFLSEAHNANHWDDTELFTLLHQPWFGCSQADIALLVRHVSEAADVSWQQLIASDMALTAIGIQSPSAFTNVHRLLFSWQSALYSQPLVGFLEQILHESGMLQWADQHPDCLTLIPCFHSLFQYALDQASTRPDYDVKSLLRDWSDMKTQSIDLPAQSLLNNPKGVHLLTAHGAKGLEFEAVFIPYALEGNWEKSKGGSESLTYLPTLRPSEEEDTLESKRRLFYVALTRAKKQLFVSYSNSDKSMKAKQQSRFVGECSTDYTIHKQIELSAVDLAKAQTLLMQPKVSANRPSGDVLDRLLNNFRLSPTSLETYLDCQVRFYYSYILKLPSAKTSFSVFGLAVHEALEAWGRGAIKGQTLSKVEVLAAFEKALLSNRYLFTKKELLALQKEGATHLDQFYDNVLVVPGNDKVLHVEYKFPHAQIQGVPVSGVVDRIDRMLDGGLRVIDYKLNVSKSKNSGIKAISGVYARQLYFYALLLKSEPDDFKGFLQEGQILAYQINGLNTFDAHTVTFEDQDLEYMQQLVVKTDAAIRRHDFFKPCNKEGCFWCAFQEDNAYGQLAKDMEQLDDAADRKLKLY